MVTANMRKGASLIIPGPKVVVRGPVNSEGEEKAKERAAVKERDAEVAKGKGPR